MSRNVPPHIETYQIRLPSDMAANLIQGRRGDLELVTRRVDANPAEMRLDQSGRGGNVTTIDRGDVLTSFGSWPLSDQLCNMCSAF